MKKKMISLVLAATMLLGASMTVFAADAPVTALGEGTIEMAASVNTAKISVTITQDGQIIANPYALEVDETNEDGSYVTLVGSTITFENGSDTAVAIGLTGSITITDGSEVTVAKSKDAIDTAKTKQVYVEAAITDDSTTPRVLYDADGAAVDALVYSASGGKMTGDSAPVLDTYDGEGDETSDTMVLTLTGATSKSATSEWKATDTFTVTTVYDIQFGSTPSTFK